MSPRIVTCGGGVGAISKAIFRAVVEGRRILRRFGRRLRSHRTIQSRLWQRLEALPRVEGVHNRSRLVEGTLTENMTEQLYRGGAGIVPW